MLGDCRRDEWPESMAGARSLSLGGIVYHWVGTSLALLRRRNVVFVQHLKLSRPSKTRANPPPYPLLSLSSRERQPLSPTSSPLSS